MLAQAVKTLSLMEYLGWLKSTCRFGVKIETEGGDITNVVVELPFAMAAYCATLVTCEYRGMWVTPWIVFDPAQKRAQVEAGLYEETCRMLKVAFALSPPDATTYSARHGRVFDVDDPGSRPGYAAPFPEDEQRSWMNPSGAAGGSAAVPLRDYIGGGVKLPPVLRPFSGCH